MSVEGDRLRKLLDGELSPEELEQDPMLAGLAERVYGEDFLDEMGVSRGDSKRALAEALQDEDDLEDLMIELPDDDLPEFDPPTHPDSSAGEGRGSKGLAGIIVGGLGLMLIVINLFYGFGNIMGGCAASIHNSCTQNMKLNLLEFHRTAEHISWGPTGVVGIPDIVAGSLMVTLIVTAVLKRRG
jgi:hypothetical protein